MSEAVLASRPETARSAVPGPRRMALALAALATAVVVLLVAASGIDRFKGKALPRTTMAPPLSLGWVDVLRPRPAFTLDASVLHGIASTYSQRQQPVEGGREDLLVFGAPGFESPAARLRFQRQPDEQAQKPSPPLFATLAREAAEAGFAIERAGLADLLPTRFGAFATVDLSLSDGTAAPVPCTGFRLVLVKPAMEIGGLACGALGRAIEREALACLLDRVALLPGSSDRAMIAFFASAEERHDPTCAPSSSATDDHRAMSHDGKPVTQAKSSRRH